MTVVQNYSMEGDRARKRGAPNIFLFTSSYDDPLWMTGRNLAPVTVLIAVS